MFKCEYCDTSFGLKANLVRHQHTARYCLSQQRNTIAKLYECEHCGISFHRNDSLKKHYKTCRERESVTDIKYQEILEKKLDDLQDEIRRLKSSVPDCGDNNRNVVVNNMQPVSEEGIQEHTEHLTLNLILDGASGFANFANHYALTNRLVCADRSRKKFRYKDETGTIVDDAGGLRLAQKFFKAIAPRNAELINREYGELQRKVSDIANGAEGEDLEQILSKSVMLQNMLRECNDAAAGKHNELSKEFISHLTKLV